MLFLNCYTGLGYYTYELHLCYTYQLNSTSMGRPGKRKAECKYNISKMIQITIKYNYILPNWI